MASSGQFAYGEEPAQNPPAADIEAGPPPTTTLPDVGGDGEAKLKSEKEIEKLAAQSAQEQIEQPLPLMETPKSDPWLNLKGFQDLFVANLFSGEARLDIPFALPPGRRGLSPELTLSYSSFKKDYISPYGYGFDLSTSSIFRNTAHGLDQLYTRNDFAVKLAGKYNELALVDGAANLYMAKTENDFTKYFFENNQWRVQDTQGNIFTFGVDSSARQADPQNPSRVYQWMLTKVVDPNGNAIEYTYSQDHNQAYLDTIRYVFTSPTESLFQIKFQYLSKSTSSVSYHSGFPVSTYRLLEHIDVQENVSSAWVTRKSYVFGYDNTSIPISRLLQVTQEAQGQTLPPIQFEYYTAGLATGLLKKAQNNTGGEIYLEYLASTGLPFIVKTLSKLTYTDMVMGVSSVKNFTYHGGHYFYDPNEVVTREYAGFREVISAESTGATTKTYFHQSQFASDNSASANLGEFQDHVSKKGRVWREEVYDGSNRKYAQTLNKWEHIPLGNARNFVKLTQTIQFTYDGDASHRDIAETYSYNDATGNLIQKVQWGEVQGSDNNTFSDIGLDKLIADISYASNMPANITSLPSQETSLDQSGNKIKETKFYYDLLALGSVDKGNLTKQEEWVSGATYIDVEKTYNTYGLVMQEKDPNDNTTNYTYDSFNLYPASVTNAKNQTAQYTYDYTSGKIKTVTDPNSRVFETVYDGFGRVKEEKVPDLAAPSTLVTKSAIAYDDSAIPRKIQTTHYLDATNSFDIFAYFDGFGRKIQERKEAETANTFSVKDFAYNELGLPAKESLSYFSTGSARTPATTDNALYTAYAYDAMKRITSVANAVGNTTNAYADWKTTITDASGKVKDLENDAYGRLAKVQEHNGANVYTITYAYDGLGNLVKITDAQGNVRNFTYDALSRRLTAQDLHAPADATFGTWTYTYDSASNITKAVDPKSQTINYTYDALNRALTEDFTGTAGTEITYAYDTGTNGVGRLTSITTPNIITAYTYDAVGNIAAENRTIQSISYPTTRSYDRQGNTTSITYPDTSQIQYAYNTAGLLESIPTFASNFDYAPIGKISKKVFANGVQTSMTYDTAKLYRLSSISTTNPSAVALQNLAYTYDPVGNVTQIVDTSNTNAAKTVVYAYDDLHRLTSATATNAANGQNYAHTFSYDSIGNIASKSDIGSYLYQGTNYANPHAATSVAGKTYSYDNNGNLIAAGSNSYAFDYQNRLVQATVSGSEGGGAGAPTPTTVSFYSASGDGSIYKNGSSWDIAHDAVSGTSRNYTSSLLYVRSGMASSTTWRIERAFLPFNTASLPDDAAITEAKLKVYVYSKLNHDNDGDDWVTVVQTSQPSATSLGTADYDLAGAINNPIEGVDVGERKDITNVATNQYLTFTLNGAGRGWIDKTVYTKLGLREGHDVIDSPFVGSSLQYNQLRLRTAEASGTSTDPVLEVTYTAAAATSSSIATIDYTYDHAGQRVKQSNGTATTIYPSKLYNVEGTKKTKHIYAGGELIATVEVVGTSTPVVYYDHTDHLGGSSVLTNASAVAEQVLDYYPFGGIRLNEKASSFDEQRKFTGQEYDKDTNLHYYVQRYYNQDVGRFTSQDPVHLLIGDEQRFKDKAQRSLEFHLSDPQSLNSYSYVNNNPLKYVDETGEIWQYIAAALFWPEVAYAPATPEETYNDPTEKVLLIGSFVPFGGGVKNVPNTVKNLANPVKNLADDAVKVAEQWGSTAFNATKQQADWVKGVENSKLQNIIQKFFQVSDDIPGGTAGAIQYTKETGKLVGDSDHIQKGQDLLRGLQNVLKQNLNRADLEKTKDLYKKLDRSLNR